MGDPVTGHWAVFGFCRALQHHWTQKTVLKRETPVGCSRASPSHEAMARHRPLGLPGHGQEGLSRPDFMTGDANPAARFPSVADVQTPLLTVKRNVSAPCFLLSGSRTIVTVWLFVDRASFFSRLLH